MLPFSTWAAGATDAGKLLREQPKAPPLTPGPSQKIIPPDIGAEPAQDDNGPTVLVSGFRIIGATLIPEQELQAQIKDAIGKKLTLGQLNAVALQLTGYYIRQGYIVRVIVPPQEVRDGIVELRVIEGKRGELQIDNKGERINSDLTGGFINNRLARGDVMDVRELSEALNILNSQPGIKAKASIKSGKGEGDIDLVIIAEEKPLANYALNANNAGSRSTGLAQASASVVLNNPTGLFDAASVLINATQGTRYVRGEYTVAAGVSGLRLGVNGSYMKYDVTQKVLSALESRGNAATLGASGFYPLAHRDDFGLSLSGSFDHKLLRDFASDSETGDRKIDTASFGVSGNNVDGFLGGGQNTFGLTLTMGRADLSGNASALASDQTTRKTDGRYAKVGFQASRQQPLSEKWILALSLSGQLAANNLDSTEQFSLGGSSGIRGYPSSEASGDEGVLGSVNFVYNAGNGISLTPFVDFGRIRLNKNTYTDWNSGNARLKNNYNLFSGGLSASWAITDTISTTATIAMPISSNPGRDSNGNDEDGRHLDARGWFAVSATF